MFRFRLAGLLALAAAVALVVPAVVAQPPEKEKPAEKAAEKAAPQADKKVVSKIKVTVPQEDAELTIEGKAMKPTGTTREFVTPEVLAGKPYEYSFTAVWAPNNYTTLTRTRTVEFKGGEDVIADLSKLDEKFPDTAKIRWVPTPDDIVAEMMKMAKITKDDVAYEPGPGDGKVLIAAVKAGAGKAVGIELDPKKAEEAVAKVKEAGLTDKITIRTGDALKVDDYGSASVVFLYMGNEFNNLLRPILEKQLKPGTRIVSHRFILGDWKPDETRKVTGQDGDEYLLHIWTVKGKDDKPKDDKAKEDKPFDNKK